MKKLQRLTFVIISAIIISSCVVITHKTQVSSMNQKTELQAFDEVSVAGSMNVVITQGNGYNVTVKGSDSKAFENLVIYVKGNELNIETKKKFMGFSSSSNMEGITVYVTMPTIEDIDLAGSGKITVNRPVTANDFHMDIAGSGDIVINDLLTCKKLEVDIAGSGNVLVKHLKANKLDTDIAGSGYAEFGDIDVDFVESDIAGSGNIKLQGRAARHTEGITGSGNVDFSGLTAQ